MDSADVGIDCYDDDENLMPRSIRIRLYHNNMLLTTFILNVSNIEKIFKLFKVVPNYGIGWNPIELDEAINNFIQITKECLG